MDTITDFVRGQDIIDLSALGISDTGTSGIVGDDLTITEAAGASLIVIGSSQSISVLGHNGSDR